MRLRASTVKVSSVRTLLGMGKGVEGDDKLQTLDGLDK